MIESYGFSMTGRSHQSVGLPCQDSHSIVRTDREWVIAAAADGVGSAGNSGKGSRIAVESVTAFCARYLPWDESVIGIKSMLRTAFNHAFGSILKESERTGNPIESYDTTLSVVLYDGHQVIFGHSGDGGIIGLSSSGEYMPLTRPQKGEDGISVIPLRAGYTRWVIDRYDGELAGVLILTDGMLDIISPGLLRNADDFGNGIYVSLASFFGDPEGFDGSEEELRELKHKIKSFIRSDGGDIEDIFRERMGKVYRKRVPKAGKRLCRELKDTNNPCALMQGVQDDKTVVGLINTDADIGRKEAGYYAEPDWIRLKDEWNRKAYPQLFE